MLLGWADHFVEHEKRMVGRRHAKMEVEVGFGEGCVEDLEDTMGMDVEHSEGACSASAAAMDRMDLAVDIVGCVSKNDLIVAED